MPLIGQFVTLASGSMVPHPWPAWDH